MNILITGATGFVGSQLMNQLEQIRTYSVTGACRKIPTGSTDKRLVALGELDAVSDWSHVIDGQHVVIHTAARVHVMNEGARDPLEEFRKVNLRGTKNLAIQAARKGVRRFIYISSIKVHGEKSAKGEPITEKMNLHPVDPYGISKLEAEIELFDIANRTGMELVVIRPPLIYGPGVRANFEKMLKWVHRGIPLPFGAVHNRRSLISLGNLVDFIITCIEHPAAANEEFLVSDQQDVSSADLLKMQGKAFGKKVWLLAVSPRLLKGAAKLFRKGDMAQRLLDDLSIDSSKATRLLGWQPPYSMEECLKKTADDFLIRNKYPAQ